VNLLVSAHATFPPSAGTNAGYSNTPQNLGFPPLGAYPSAMPDQGSMLQPPPAQMPVPQSQLASAPPDIATASKDTPAQNYAGPPSFMKSGLGSGDLDKFRQRLPATPSRAGIGNRMELHTLLQRTRASSGATQLYIQEQYRFLKKDVVPKSAPATSGGERMGMVNNGAFSPARYAEAFSGLYTSTESDSWRCDGAQAGHQRLLSSEFEMTSMG